MPLLIRSLLLVAIATIFPVVAQARPDSPASSGSAAKAPAPAVAASAKPNSTAAPAAPNSIVGKVLETMDSGGYTYLKLKTETGEVWAAVGKSLVTTGETATVLNPMMMENFESSSLHRKFERIAFGALASPAAPTMAGLSEGEKKEALVANHASAASASPDLSKVQIKKASGASGKTVAEVHTNRAALKETSISVRGQVVKVNRGVMGKNWVHLRDGTGSKDKGDDDLTFTTPDEVKQGDIVLATGVVKVDRDFGAGYVYGVIVEDAKIVKE